jgi:hypothetical protein
MKKHLMVVAAIGLIPLLAACGSAKPSPTDEATPVASAATASPTASSSPANTPTPIAEETAEAVAEPEAAFPTPNPNPECVAEPIPEDPNIPAVTADDWSKGPEDALVTLVEYGDFQ